jgi:hypothetical protein
VKRLALVAALFGGPVLVVAAALTGCGPFIDHAARHPIVYDVIDGVLIVGATTTAIADNNEAVRGTALGVDLVALFLVPALVVATVAGLWRPE